MAGELDITRGDQRKVGYYVGPIVSCSHRHVLEVQVCCLLICIVLLGILVFSCNGNRHNFLEQLVGPHWEKACLVDRHVWINGFHVMLWSFSNIAVGGSLG